MGSEFPGSPRVLKGGIVAYRLPDLFPTVIVFQYNPDEVSRSFQCARRQRRRARRREPRQRAAAGDA